MPPTWYYLCMISFEDFKKLDIRIGKIISAERIPDADKLLKLVFDIGDHERQARLDSDEPSTRQVIAGIAEYYNPEDLIGKEMPVLVNLEPRKLRGFDSNGMILAVGADDKPVLLYPEEEVPPGSVVK
ncbi:MAG: Methionine-tRNA ligase [Parcubacteria group bacterium GW2011_GWA1_50_14]|nr:MAG: Methionine-tRNA ligase [Parcubacteria group bacterium GW2011_GWA1_50_14]